MSPVPTLQPDDESDDEELYVDGFAKEESMDGSDTEQEDDW